MSWQILVIRIAGTLAGVIALGVLFWSLSWWLRRRQIRQLEANLTEHLRSVGVSAEERRVKGTVVHSHEGDDTVILRHLVTTRVWLRGIQSIEIWRIIRKGKKESVTLDEMTFVVTPESGMSLNRIPLLTNIVKTHTTSGKSGFQWRGFEWGRLPLLVDRLDVDTDLNSRLLRHLDNDLLDDLRITALSGDRVGITTSYRPQQLPSRDFLTCIEDIADHIREYVAEFNRIRELQNNPSR
ncbi:MAG TPA: hypothetical protein G4O18_02605 [Dehalococcoidia bacterium]|nr:hypothetical protein [Dehalococcoidia bacterium]